MGAIASNFSVVPSVHPVRLANLARTIQFEHRCAFLVGAFLILFGGPLVFIGPLLMASLFWVATLGFLGVESWPAWLLGCSLVMVPALFWCEAHQRGSFFTAGNLDVAPGGLDGNSLSPLPLMATGEFGILLGIAANPRLTASSFVEWFLLGPRMILDGAFKIRRAWELRHVSRGRAAEIVTDLTQHRFSVQIEMLLRPGESSAHLSRVLCLLLFHEWIGISAYGDRVWILSQARKRVRF